jgi:hypothetical protein
MVDVGYLGRSLGITFFFLFERRDNNQAHSETTACSLNQLNQHPLFLKEKCGMSLGRPRGRTDERHRPPSAQPRTSEGCRSHGRHGCDVYKYYGYRMEGARMNKQPAVKMVCPFPPLCSWKSELSYPLSGHR